MITTLIFDYGGVLHAVPEAHGTGIFEVLSDNLALPLEEIKTLYFANNHRNNIGNWSHKQTLLYVVENLDPKKISSAEVLIDEFLAKRELNQELLTLIRKIKARGFTVALLSNYGPF